LAKSQEKRGRKEGGIHYQKAMVKHYGVQSIERAKLRLSDHAVESEKIIAFDPKPGLETKKD
jgi:hypothetical protein